MSSALDSVLTDSAAATEPNTDDTGAIARQRGRVDKIIPLVAMLHEFADKVPTEGFPFGVALREALDQVDAGIASAYEALDKAPSGYKHPRAAGASRAVQTWNGVKVQIAEDQRDKYKSHLSRTQFGVTAIGTVDGEPDERKRALLRFDGGACLLVPVKALVVQPPSTEQAK